VKDEQVDSEKSVGAVAPAKTQKQATTFRTLLAIVAFAAMGSIAARESARLGGQSFGAELAKRSAGFAPRPDAGKSTHRGPDSHPFATHEGTPTPLDSRSLHHSPSINHGVNLEPSVSLDTPTNPSDPRALSSGLPSSDLEKNHKPPLRPIRMHIRAETVLQYAHKISAKPHRSKDGKSDGVSIFGVDGSGLQSGDIVEEIAGTAIASPDEGISTILSALGRGEKFINARVRRERSEKPPIMIHVSVEVPKIIAPTPTSTALPEGAP
jgi:hypothetical protein